MHGETFKIQTHFFIKFFIYKYSTWVFNFSALKENTSNTIDGKNTAIKNAL